MKTYKEALNIITEVARSRCSLISKTDLLPIEKSLGRVCAENILVSEPQPLFDNSAMDGFALRSEWTCDATSLDVKEFEIVGCLGAGSVHSENVIKACCFEIMTGAMLPTGFDCVIRVEDAKVVQKDGKRFLVLSKPLSKWDQVRRQGEDFALDDPLLNEGEVIRASHVLALASQGVSEVKVKSPLRIGLLSTGSEIVSHLESPQAGMIRNTTLPYLVAKCSSPNISLKLLGSVVDSPEKLKSLLKPALKDFDILITTGAVSAGRFDIIPPVLGDMGAVQHFHKVAMRPGKPLLFAEFASGPLVFGFPGNPISSVVAFRFFLEPLLRTLLGTKVEMPYQLPLAEDVKKPEDLCCFWKAKVENAAGPEFSSGFSNGTKIKTLKGQESFRIKPLIAANHWAVLPEGKAFYKAGELVEVYPIDSEL
jgi:molybdopterin molybdotransferase